MHSGVKVNFIKHIKITNLVSVSSNDNFYTFLGPKGSIVYELHRFFNLKIDELVLSLSVNDISFKKRDLFLLPALFNTSYAMLKNCLYGVTNLFEQFLVLKGVGYKVFYDNELLALNFLLGYSHPVVLNVPSNIFVELPSNSEIIIRSVCKRSVGQFAADIRYIKAPEVYKGNGIRYRDENIVLKVPKKAK
jgi:large subunit ribosomal protein L6